MNNFLVPPENAKELAYFITWMGNDGIYRTFTKARSELNIESAIRELKTDSNDHETFYFI